jgi:hypothetical protein
MRSRSASGTSFLCVFLVWNGFGGLGCGFGRAVADDCNKTKQDTTQSNHTTHLGLEAARLNLLRHRRRAARRHDALQVLEPRLRRQLARLQHERAHAVGERPPGDLDDLRFGHGVADDVALLLADAAVAAVVDAHVGELDDAAVVDVVAEKRARDRVGVRV